jgi:outer membrane protein OmpA-like peptidoglycan-associated protein
MANTQQRTDGSGSAKELAILVGILLMVVAGAVGTYWIHSRGVEAAGIVAVKPAEPKASRVTVPAPPAGVFHADVYFDFKSTRLRADAARVLQETAGSMDLANAWVVLVQGHTDRQGPAEYNRTLAQRRAETVKQFLVELGVPEPSVKVAAVGPEAALCDDPGKECQQLNRRVHLEIRKLAAAVPATTSVAATNGGDQAQADAASPAGDR